MKISLLKIAIISVAVAIVSGQSEECDAAQASLEACILGNLNAVNLILCLVCLSDFPEDPPLELIDPGASCAQEGADIVCSTLRSCSACRGCFSELDDSVFKCAEGANSDITNCVCPDGCRANGGSIFFGSKC